MSTTLEIKEVPTKPFKDQKPGTSGLRKKVVVFRDGFYLHNFVQSCFNSLPQKELHGSTIVVGGDGRFWNTEAIQIIIKIAAGNGIGKLLIGQNGILSTPAISAIIRERKVYGGLILTASHNPGGEDKDFGIKYNTSNGGPAPEGVTNAIYQETLKISHIKMASIPDVDLSKIGKQTFSNFEIEVIDSIEDYLKVMKSIFDFPALKKFLSRKDFSMLYDCMSGVTGPYCTRIFVDELGGPKDSVMRNVPLPDFGHGHPDPNLTYAEELVDRCLHKKLYDLGAASDGDGDRNMVVGKGFFVSPSDSVAIIAANAKAAIPYFAKHGLTGISRSMPTGAALDKVAEQLKLEFFEVPTGWKFFGNLMDANRIQICGEESFGTGSNHIREKDGIWAVLCWLSILEYRNRNTEIGKLVTIEQIVKDHWKQFGRNYFTRYDYEEVDTEAANHVMSSVTSFIKDSSNTGKLLSHYKVSLMDDFEYKDPIDHSISKNQGLRIIFSDGSRMIFRLSGTGSSGATIRVYIDKYENDEKKLYEDTQVALRDLIEIALELSQMKKFTGREQPTVIT